MRILKWGRSLAVRLPAALAENLGLKEGDDIEIIVVRSDPITFAQGRSRVRALERIRKLRRVISDIPLR